MRFFADHGENISTGINGIGRGKRVRFSLRKSPLSQRQQGNGQDKNRQGVQLNIFQFYGRF